MGEKHSKAAKFSTVETLGDKGVVVKEPADTSKKYQEEVYLGKKKEPKYKEVGGEVMREDKQQPYVSKKKPTKIRDEVSDVSKPIMTEEERTKRKETMVRDEENLRKKHDKEYREKMMKTSLREMYGDYGEAVNTRVDGIVGQVRESRSDFEDIMESYMNKLTNTKLLLDEIQKDNAGVSGTDVRQRMNNLEVCVLRSNFFISSVIQNILSQRETLVFQTPDPFFKLIPMYLWRKFEKHYDNLMLIQKRYPDSESAFRSLVKESAQMEGYKKKKPKYEYSKYDTLTEEFNQLVNYLESVTGDTTSNVTSSEAMERKYDRLIRLLSELENDSKKNYSHMRNAIRKLKEDIRELTNIHEQAENVYSDMPKGFETLAMATRRGEKKRVELKRCSEELREVSEVLSEIRRDLTSISASMKQFDRTDRSGEVMNERSLMDTSSRIQSIFWHLYVVKHLFVPELFSMDSDESSFMKIKDIVKRMNFTNLFKNTYSPMDAKTVLMKYIFEVLLETNDMLDRHIEYSFSIERRDMGEVESNESGGQYMKKQSKTMNRTIDDSITKTQSIVNQMNMLMGELEETFSGLLYQ